MDRKNIWVHVGLAVILVSFAAVLGGIDRMASSLRNAPKAERPNRESFTPQLPALPGTIDSAELMVRFKPGVTAERIREILGKTNDRLEDSIESVSGLVVVDDLDDADAAETAKYYSSLPEVEYAEPIFRIELERPVSESAPRDLVYRNDDNEPNDPNFAEQWALNNLGQNGGKARADIDALKAWQVSKGSADVVVAVLDSGVDYRHADLWQNIWTRPDNIPRYFDADLGSIDDVHGYDGTLMDGKPSRGKGNGVAISDPMDDNGHGTHCAGIIGAMGNNGIGIAGVNWNVKLMPLKFLGRGGIGSSNDAIEAINYAIDRKKAGVNVRIISASWGSTLNSRALRDTIKAAGDAGILFVAAAGNDGANTDLWPHYPSSYRLKNLISVAAVDRNDDLASFSNFGKKTVDLAAPGKDILSTWLGDDYREASGTSMATPFVSGVAALIVANNPSISVEELKRTLLASVDKRDALKGKVATGGTLCAANALGISD